MRPLAERPADAAWLPAPSLGPAEPCCRRAPTHRARQRQTRPTSPRARPHRRAGRGRVRTSLAAAGALASRVAERRGAAGSARSERVERLERLAVRARRRPLCCERGLVVARAGWTRAHLRAGGAWHAPPARRRRQVALRALPPRRGTARGEALTLHAGRRRRVLDRSRSRARDAPSAPPCASATSRPRATRSRWRRCSRSPRAMSRHDPGRRRMPPPALAPSACRRHRRARARAAHAHRVAAAHAGRPYELLRSR